MCLKSLLGPNRQRSSLEVDINLSNISSAVKEPMSTKDVRPRYRAEANVGLGGGVERLQETICRKILLSCRIFCNLNV